MIKFGSLDIQNFLSVELASLSLSDQGLVLIEGVNEDDPSAASNGAGKSSIVDAISWVLYGETARGASGDSVINIKAGRETLVCLEVEIDGRLYQIERGRKHRVLKNRVKLLAFNNDTGKMDDLTLGTDKLTQEKINNLLGCTPDIFNASIYMGQEAMPDLPSMTDKELKAIIEQALALDKLDDALEVCKGRYATAFHVATNAQNNVKMTESDLIREVETAKKLEAQRADIEKELTDLELSINTLKNDLTNTHVQHAAEAVALQSKLKAIPAVDLVGVLSEADAAQDKVMEATKDLTEKVKKINARLDANAYDEQRHARTLHTVELECPTCKRPHDHAEDAAKIMQDAQEAMEKILAENAKLNAAKKKLQGEIADITKQAAVARQAVISSHEANHAAHKALERKIAEVDRMFGNDKARLEADIASQQKWFEEKIKRLRAVDTEYEQTKKRVGALESLIRTHEWERDDANERLDMLEKVKHIMGRKGFRGEVLDQITPYLNARTSYYLNQLSDENIEAVWNTITTNAQGDYVENFHIAVKHVSGVDKFANLSGGEKRKVRLACAMAMQDLIGTRAVKPIKLFVADEIDDAIDAAGLELLMGVLEQKAKDVGTVFIISHNDISDWVRQKITVVKKDGQSTFK